ncbi:uncharacterized protein LOC130250059 [Oenanthe melanoleuca]|uniref:uncharacterized protein LOC130250059 n=1 Tax=Oenanthe melanoleuca TaxID=2939378 RepID=UPI0024C108CC|nr:uncharacterized protein LOC130250059 [Oenanthe melanoleuca]
MSKRQEANAHCQSREGQPLLSKRQQVPQRLPQAAADVTLVTIMPLHGDRLVPRQDTSQTPTGQRTKEASLERGHSLPHSGTVTRTQILSVSDLPPLHGPPLTVTPPCWFRPEMPKSASTRVKLPLLPAAPAASASSPKRRAQSADPVSSRSRELVTPSPWGSLAADRAQVTPSPPSSAERLWQGSVAGQGHRLPPLRGAGVVPLHTGTQPAWEHLGHSETEELSEVQGEHGGKTSRDLLRGRAPCLWEDTSIKSTGTQEHSCVCQEADSKAQVLPSTPGLTEGSTGETGNSSELMSPGLIAELCSPSDNSWVGNTLLKDPEKCEEEEFADTEAAGDEDRDSQSVSLAPLKVEKAEAEASALAGDPWEEGPSELFPITEPEETSGFSGSSSSGDPSERKGTHRPAEQSAQGKLPCTETEEASKHLLHITAEELEELEEDILSSVDQESPLVPHSICSWGKDCAGETEHHSQLVPPDLFEELWSLFNNKDVPCWDTRVDQLLEKWEEEELPDRDTAGEGDSEPESELCLPLHDEEAEPAGSPLVSDPCDEGHSEALLRAPPEEAKASACVSTANPMEEADAACMEAICSQASLAQENPCGAEAMPRACPVPAQPPTCSVPSSPTDRPTVPQPPAPRRWRSIVRGARRALRRLFSFSCLRGQPEE